MAVQVVGPQRERFPSLSRARIEKHDVSPGALFTAMSVAPVADCTSRQSPNDPFQGARRDRTSNDSTGAMAGRALQRSTNEVLRCHWRRTPTIGAGAGWMYAENSPQQRTVPSVRMAQVRDP